MDIKSIKYFLLSAMIFLNALLLISWTERDTRPAAWDQAIHLKNSFEYRDRLATQGISSLLKPAYFNYPPFFHISVIPFLKSVKDVADAGSRSNVMFLALLMVAVFLIGQKLLTPWHGLTAAFLVSAYPLVFDMATQTMIDLALASLVAISFFALLMSNSFSNRGWSAFLGLFIGLAMLTKWTASLYLLFPVLWALLRAIRNKAFHGVVLSLLCCLVVMGPWYLANMMAIIVRLPAMAGLPPASGYSLPGWANIFWYPLSWFEQINFLFVLCLVVGLALVTWKKTLRLVALWFWGSLIIFSLISNHNTRYFLPALPAAAILSVAWLSSSNKKSLIFMNGLIAVYFSIFHLFPAYSYYLPSKSFPLPVMGSRAPLLENWKHAEIIEKIDSLHHPKMGVAHVLTISNAACFHSTTLDLSLKVRGINHITFRGPSKQRWFELVDFIIVKSGDIGPEFTNKTIRDCRRVLDSQPDWFQKTFQEVARWPLPDKSEAILFQKNPRPLKMFDLGRIQLTFEQLDIPHVIAENVQVDLNPINQSETSVGRLQSLTITAKKISYKTISFENVKVELLQPQINLPLFLENQDLQLLRLDALQPKATLKAEELLTYVSKKAKWLKQPFLYFKEDVIDIGGHVGGLVPLRIALKLNVENHYLHTKLMTVRFAGVPIPKIIFSAMLNREISLRANDEMPYNLDIYSIRGENGNLQIN